MKYHVAIFLNSIWVLAFLFLCITVFQSGCFRGKSLQPFEESQWKKQMESNILYDLTFENTPLDMAIKLVNTKLNKSSALVEFTLDLSPTKYKKDKVSVSIDTHIEALLNRTRSKYRKMQNTTLPTVNFTSKDSLLEEFFFFLCDSIARQSPLFLYQTDTSIVLRLSPSVWECRAYQISEVALNKITQAHTNASLLKLFCEQPYEIMLMSWIDNARVLLRVGEPEDLEYFEYMVNSIHGARRIEVRVPRNSQQ